MRGGDLPNRGYSPSPARAEEGTLQGPRGWEGWPRRAPLSLVQDPPDSGKPPAPTGSSSDGDGSRPRGTSMETARPQRAGAPGLIRTKPGAQRAATSLPTSDTQRAQHTSAFQKPGFAGRWPRRAAAPALRPLPAPTAPPRPSSGGLNWFNQQTKQTRASPCWGAGGAQGRPHHWRPAYGGSEALLSPVGWAQGWAGPGDS